MITVLVLVLAMPGAALTAPRPIDVAGGGAETTGRFIVVLEDAADPDRLLGEWSRDYGLAPVHVYRHALKGFAVEASASAVRDLARSRTEVRWVEAERYLRPAAAEQQQMPTGVRRVGGRIAPPVGSTPIDLDVAIIDTGVTTHPDLRIAGGRNFYTNDPDDWDDKYSQFGWLGHGTQVAGIIGALDNDVGVVGVAPGARIWALRACGHRDCRVSAMVAAMDWAAGKKESGEIDFAVANMSIGAFAATGTCATPTDALHAAICGLLDVGVLLTLSAGNESREFELYPEAVGVSAINDVDGLAGGASLDFCGYGGADDTLARFSNYGDSVDVAAPGTCTLTTHPEGGHVLFGGTSGAAPHVAGAILRYLAHHDRPAPQDAAEADAVLSALLGDAWPQNTHPCSYTSDRVAGPLLSITGPAFGGEGGCEFGEPTVLDVAFVGLDEMLRPNRPVGSETDPTAEDWDGVATVLRMANVVDYRQYRWRFTLLRAGRPVSNAELARVQFWDATEQRWTSLWEVGEPTPVETGSWLYPPASWPSLEVPAHGGDWAAGAPVYWRFPDGLLRTDYALARAYYDALLGLRYDLRVELVVPTPTGFSLQGNRVQFEERDWLTWPVAEQSFTVGAQLRSDFAGFSGRTEGQPIGDAADPTSDGWAGWHTRTRAWDAPEAQPVRWRFYLTHDGQPAAHDVIDGIKVWDGSGWQPAHRGGAPGTWLLPPPPEPGFTLATTSDVDWENEGVEHFFHLPQGLPAGSWQLQVALAQDTVLGAGFSAARESRHDFTVADGE